MTTHTTLPALDHNALHLVLITGMSGAGKSVALRALEDSGYFCVDNLPPELIVQLLQTLQLQPQKRRHIAIAVDGRSATTLPLLPRILKGLEGAHINVTLLYLDASDDALVRRFSETRRRHPLSTQLAISKDNCQQQAVTEAIAQERELLADLKTLGTVIDTSLLRPAQLQSWVKMLVQASTQNSLTLIFESFAYKRGLPLDADYVFDVRMLPNPYYEPDLRHFTGKDEVIQTWLEKSPEVLQMTKQLAQLLQNWLPAFANNHRSYLTVAIGCTGGQHRSVYVVEKLAQQFNKAWNIIVRHRELDSRPST